MTDVQRALAKWIFIILALFFSGFFVRGYMADKHELELKAEHQAQQLEAAKQFQDKVVKQTAAYNLLQGSLYALAANHHKDLSNALAENARLAGDLGVAQRMRLKGTTCPQPTAAADAAAGELGDGAGVVLSGETRLAVFDLRADLVRDRGKLTYLQGYVRRLGLAPDGPPDL